MAIKTNIDNNVEEAEIVYSDSPRADFNSGNEPAYTFEESTGVQNNNAELAIRKHKIKTDVVSTIVTGLLNAAPIVIDTFKHRNDPVPYKPQKSDFVRLGVSMIMPTVQLVDTVAFKGKLQNTIEEKTPFKMGDIRNVVNIVQAYPATHKALGNFMNNVQAQSNGKQQVVTSANTTRDAVIGCINTISPYVVDKFCDENKTFVEKCSSIIPLKIFGGLVRKLVSTNPKLQQGYDVATSLVRVADYGNKTLGSAVRSNSNMRTGAANTLGTILDVVQDATGMTRGNISRYGDQYDGWNGGARFNNF